MAYKNIGNAIAEWEDNEPFIFTISEEASAKDAHILKTIRCDLSELRSGFEDEFLLHFKDILIEYRNKVTLNTVKIKYLNLEPLFRRIIKNGLFDKKIAIIDESFLLALNTIKDTLSKTCLTSLKRLFKFSPHSPLFAPGLSNDDFPFHLNKKGQHGLQIDHILAKALTRAACVEILTRCEQAYEDDQMDVGYFSFVNLAFAVYVRPESYRQIRLNDLVYDTKGDAFFLYIMPAKSGVHRPDKICYRINKHVGVLLQKQRQHVAETYGHLVDPNDIQKLALFPARALTKDKSRWSANHANESFGQLVDGAAFAKTYYEGIRLKLKIVHVKLNGNALRHTVGTQLAQSGCSAKTIAAVLKHADDRVCRAYVDIAFHGLINELSDAMRSPFEDHLPAFQRFRSTDDSIQADKAIYSEDIMSGRTELTGECGKQIRCHAAPFTCYECKKFIPCWDADHSLNQDIMQREIDDYRNAGTTYHQMVEKAQTIKIRIQLVMVACDRYHQTFTDQDAPDEPLH